MLKLTSDKDQRNKLLSLSLNELLRYIHKVGMHSDCRQLEVASMTTRSPRVTRISTRLFFRESILYQWLSQRVNAFLLHCVYTFRLLLDFTTAFWCRTYVTNFTHQKYAWLHMVCKVVSGFKLFNLVTQHVKWYYKYKSSDGSKTSARHNMVQFFPCSFWKKLPK